MCWHGLTHEWAHHVAAARHRTPPGQRPPPPPGSGPALGAAAAAAAPPGEGATAAAHLLVGEAAAGAGAALRCAATTRSAAEAAATAGTELSRPISRGETEGAIVSWGGMRRVRGAAAAAVGPIPRRSSRIVACVHALSRVRLDYPGIDTWYAAVAVCRGHAPGAVLVCLCGLGWKCQPA
jgi:hypothetical protein